MKFLILSDIHGSAKSLETALSTFDNKYDSIIICGDYLNHGPRNPLPDGWDTKKTAQILNSLKEKIICVRGNCDSEVDQMMLEFPCLTSYTTIALPLKEKIRRLFIHHGHLYTHEELLSWLPEDSIVISGHTHITNLEKKDNLYYFNPGSISLPKCDDGKTCGIIETDENGRITASLYEISGKMIREMIF
ncbi:MAG: phosphodiesterase [Treponema sp.]|nr:phosphodiesterase [Treponema sp.]